MRPNHFTPTMKKSFPYLLFAIIALQACEPVEEEQKIARVFDQVLYASDLEDVVPTRVSKTDSIEIIRTYVNNWVRENSLLHHAELNLSEELKNVEKQLTDYRNSLIIYQYEKELIQQKLDTAVAMEEIEAYYKNNKENFELKDYIVKVLYIKLYKNTPDLETPERLYRLKNPEDHIALEAYCSQYAANFYFDEDAWLYFDDLLKEVPLKIYDKENFLQKNDYIKFEDDNFLYLLNVIDYKLKDGLSPLSLEVENIRNIIINQRKLALITKMREDVYEDALGRNNIEIY